MGRDEPTKFPTPQVQAVNLRRIELAALIVEVTSNYSEAFEQAGIEIELDVPPSLWVEIDPILMRDAFRKLIDNAVEAMPNGGQLTVTSLIGRTGLEIEFADSGRGISDELKERLFEPFATTKHDHAGLGLSLVRDVAISHQGSVSVDDCPDGGTAFTLALPSQSTARQAA